MTLEKQQIVMCNLLEIDMTSLIQYATQIFRKINISNIFSENFAYESRWIGMGSSI